jgi:hypothetical protein
MLFQRVETQTITKSYIMTIASSKRSTRSHSPIVSDFTDTIHRDALNSLRTRPARNTQQRRKPNLQRQIAEAIQTILEPQGVAVVLGTTD